MFEGVYLDVRSVDFVHNLLDGNWISMGSFDFFGVCKGNIFEAMDFTKTPEHGVMILTCLLYSEHFREVNLLQCSHSNMVH